MQILGKSDQTSENWEIKALFCYPLDYLSYLLSLKLFCQFSLIPKTPNWASAVQRQIRTLHMLTYTV